MKNAITIKKPSTVERQNIYDIVTNTIIQQLEAGVIPWQKPWKGGDFPKNVSTNKYYRGINIVLLWSAAISKNYQSEEWGTLLQWNEKNERIRKDEKSSLIVKFDKLEKEIDGEPEEIPYLKKYHVFNREQLASYQPSDTTEQPQSENLVEKITAIDRFVENTKAVIEHGGNRACYIPSEDKILLPLPTSFTGTARCTATESYISVRFHELVHWTGNETRLNRKFSKRFDDQKYAIEELVAELGAAFLCAGFEMVTAEKGDHASYIDNWLKVLKENNRFIFAAASAASKAVDYLNDLQPQ